MADALTKDELWKLLQIAIDEEYMYIKENQSRTALYAGFVVTILGASVAGTMQAHAGVHWYALAAGPAVAAALAWVAIESARRFYQCFLEALSIRAKVEADLGLADPPHAAVVAARLYWSTKPYVPPRWLEGRLRPAGPEGKSTVSTDEVQVWINSHMAGGEQGQVRRLFFSLMSVAALLFVGFLIVGSCLPFLPA